ncbi:hypothetical protein BT93_D0770 [Corymbia citriodora subsp. variegata]|nr:hypothetical protein BT93_D0770 [Corymbia citriodora subsp. variegata]KAF8031656.1 hypothetical protein BT93_D0770 [Corymbia citriodora subsp. variegata]
MMEAQSRKRGREGDVEDSQIDTSDSSSSKRQLVGISCEHSNNHEDHRDKKLEEKSNCNDEALDEWDYCMSSLGVFDFPWLREGDGMIFGSEEDGESKVEDTFPFSLSFPADHGMEFCEPLSCQNNSASLLDSPGDHHDVRSPDRQQLSAPGGDDLEGLDCIWSSVLNQPLEGAL